MDREAAQALQETIDRMMFKVNDTNSAIAVSDIPDNLIDEFDTARERLEAISTRIALILENY